MQFLVNLILSTSLCSAVALPRTPSSADQVASTEQPMEQGGTASTPMQPSCGESAPATDQPTTAPGQASCPAAIPPVQPSCKEPAATQVEPSGQEPTSAP